MRIYTALLSSTLLVGCAKQPGLNEAIQTYGYTSITPPSTLMTPGTVVYRIEQDPLQAGTICRAETVFGEEDITTQSSTASMVQELSQEGSFSLDVNLTSLLNGNANAEHIKNVNVTLKNATLIEVPLADAMKAIDENRQDYCAEAIEESIKQGREVSLIASVLRADVTYDVVLDTSAGLSAEASQELIEGLAVSMGLSASNVNNTNIEGTGLFWGARQDVELATRGLEVQSMGSGALEVATLTSYDSEPLAVPPPEPEPEPEPEEGGEEGAEEGGEESEGAEEGGEESEGAELP